MEVREQGVLFICPVRVKDLEAYMYRAWTPGCATGTCWSESLGRYPWYWKCACRSSWADWFKFPVLRKELGQVIFRAPFQTQLWAYDFVSRFSPVEGWRRLAVVIKTQHQDFWFLCIYHWVTCCSFCHSLCLRLLICKSLCK